MDFAPGDRVLYRQHMSSPASGTVLRTLRNGGYVVRLDRRLQEISCGDSDLEFFGWIDPKEVPAEGVTIGEE